MRRIEDTIGVADIMPDKLLQWKVSLNEKLTNIRTLDDEILALIDNDAIDDKIEQADVFSERLQQLICRVEQLILNVSSVSSTRSSPPPDRRSTTVEVSTTPLTDPPPDGGLPSDRGGSKVKLPKLTPKDI